MRMGRSRAGSGVRAAPERPTNGSAARRRRKPPGRGSEHLRGRLSTAAGPGASGIRCSHREAPLPLRSEAPFRRDPAPPVLPSRPRGDAEHWDPIGFSIRGLAILLSFPQTPPSLLSPTLPAAAAAAHGSAMRSQLPRQRSGSRRAPCQLPTSELTPGLLPTPPSVPPPTSWRNSPPSSAAGDAALFCARKCAIPVPLRRRRRHLPAPSPRPFPRPHFPRRLTQARGVADLAVLAGEGSHSGTPRVGLHFPAGSGASLSVSIELVGKWRRCLYPKDQ